MFFKNLLFSAHCHWLNVSWITSHWLQTVSVVYLTTPPFASYFRCCVKLRLHSKFLFIFLDLQIHSACSRHSGTMTDIPLVFLWSYVFFSVP